MMPFRFEFNGLLMGSHVNPVTDPEIVHETRIEAYKKCAAMLKRAEAEQARRLNSEEIKRGRDPKPFELPGATQSYARSRADPTFV